MNLQTNSQASRGEEELISKSVKGNQDALDQLFAHYARALYPTALRLLGSLEDAEDALQDALLSVFRNLGRFEARSQFSTWLTRIVINTALMRLRSQRAHPVASLDGEGGEEDELTLADKLRDPAPDPKELCAQAELEGLVERHLKVLSPALRSAWLLREVEGLSTEEASEALGVPEGTLKSQLHRACLQLRNRLRPRTEKQPSCARVRRVGLCPASG